MTYFIIFALFSLTALLLADYKNESVIAGWLKASTSICMVGYAFMQMQSSPNLYAYLVFAAIVFGLLGDVFLIPKSKNSFLIGMLAFLVGHILYIIAFAQQNFAYFEWAAGFFGISIAMYIVFRWVESSLKGVLRIGVIVYMFALAVMCSLALSVRQDGGLTLIGLGATLFMVSDFFVASHRFKKPQLINRLVGLPLYYLGQFILATTITQMTTSSPWLPV